MNVLLIFCAVQIPGTDGILLGAETLRGLYPVDAVSTVGRICAEVCLYLFIRINFSLVGKSIDERKQPRVNHPNYLTNQF